MKMLLTSCGFTNEKIIDSFKSLSEKPINTLKLVFIPTAANVEPGDIGWLIDDLNNCKKLGFKEIDIVDISALPVETIDKKLENADVIFIGGGNTNHLIRWLDKTGLRKTLPILLKTRIYVGLSAGSMVVGNFWNNELDVDCYYEPREDDDLKYLNYVNFMVVPHLNSPDFPKVRLENIEKISRDIKNTIYALDDDSAVLVNDDSCEIITSGVAKLFSSESIS